MVLYVLRFVSAVGFLLAYGCSARWFNSGYGVGVVFVLKTLFVRSLLIVLRVRGCVLECWG